MIRITNGTRVTTVTRGAFHEMYEPRGWKIADLEPESSIEVYSPSEAVKEPETLSQSPETASEEEPIGVEIPISEMRLSELKDYAERNGVDISQAKTKQEIRSIIQSEMGA